MITLLLGSDMLAKKEYVQAVAKSRGAEIQTFSDSSNMPPLLNMFEPQLFGAPKVVVLKNLWNSLDPELVLNEFGNSKDAHVFVLEDSLDKRKKVNQDFLKNDRVKVVQLDAPLGVHASHEWIMQFCSNENIKIDSAASMAVARALIVNEDTSLDIIRAQNELQKLKHYASGNTITIAMVIALVESSTSVDVFELLNAVANKNTKLALQLLQTFFDTETADEKSSAIKIVAMLADQFRSLLIVLDAQNRGMSDESISSITGWKSGRLFVMKKLARNFGEHQVKQTLAKLENLDREMKTGSLPAQVILDLIVAGM